MRGYIYALHSAERPEIIKIGRTVKKPEVRCSEHNANWYLSINTWKVVFWRWVENCVKAESEIHQHLKPHNLKAKSHKEAFRIDLYVARDIMVRVCDNYPSKEDKPQEPVLRKRKSLDMLIYKHIRNNGPLSEALIRNKQILKDSDFYGWVNEVKLFLSY